MAQKVHRPHNFRALSKPKHIQKADHHHYWPYIPVLLLVAATFLVSLIQPIPSRGVLAYATDVSQQGLLDATNQQRKDNKSPELKINDALSAAAQAKANDMVTRNYWSHNTPDGQEPWVFIHNAGYRYQKAGENLAYGFAGNEQAVTGWMNSPSHRENLLDSAFTEVGFGFANSSNYNSNGEETVIVAEYGRPLTLGASTSPATNPAAQPVTTLTPTVVEPASKHISRIQTLTGSNNQWIVFAVGLITGLCLMLILFKHALGIRRVIRNGERFITHHPLLDIVLVGLVLVGSFLYQTTGIIR